MKKKQQKVMTKEIDEQTEKMLKEFVTEHPVGSKINGIHIFDIARDNQGNIYAIVPLHEFAKCMEDMKPTDKGN